MTKKNHAQLIDKFDAEAARFTELAKDLSLLHVKKPEGDPAELLKAREHLIRAETYKDAARIANNFH